MVERLIDWELVSADEFDDAAGVVTGEAFFKIVDAVIFFRFIREALDAVEVVGFKFVLRGVFDHVPLDEVLGVVVFHVLFVAAGIEVDDLVSVEHKHSYTEGYQRYIFLGTLPRARRHGPRSLRICPVGKYAPRKSIFWYPSHKKFDFTFFVEEVVHVLIVTEGAVFKMAAI